MNLTFLNQLFEQYNNPEGYLMLGGLVVCVLAFSLMGGSKGKITTGRLVGKAEQLAATSKALAQLRLRSTYMPPQLVQPNQSKQVKRRKTPQSSTAKAKPIARDRVTLWAGKMPRFWWQGQRGLSARLQTFLGSSPAVWLPDSQRGVLIIGAPGSGKTVSAANRMAEAAFVQGIPAIVYDKKGDQMEELAPLAAQHGYEVYVFAPGESFSGVLNPVEFLKSPRDAVMAGQLGVVINRNAKEGDSGKSDEFFSKAGDLLAKGLMQLARSTDYPDMAMVYSLLRLPGLVHRIDYAVQTGVMDEWIASSFVQFLSAKDAEKTISGILTTASATFSGFIQEDLLRVFIGQSTIPTRIEGKQLIVFKLDDERRSVVGPLVAAAMHMAVVRNLSTPRTTPLAVFVDELPSLRFYAMPQWINEYRSNGGCFILGIQSLNQLYEAYGEKMGEAIASACSTHLLFNPNDVKTAESYSKRYGEKEVLIHSKSRSRNAGQQSSTTTSWNESLQKMPLFTPDQILRFTEGQCIITNPGYRSGTEGSIPYFLKIPMPQSEFKRLKQSTGLWQSHVRPYLEQQVKPVTGEQLTQALQARVALADQILPLPPQMAASPQATPTTTPNPKPLFSAS